VTDAQLWLNDVRLVVEWSEFASCHFRQRVKPITNEQGFSAQGSFANRQALYRNCVFERVRFKLLGGFSMSRGWYEDCTFLNCRWEGHFAHDASVVDSTFIGRMNGCVWFGESERGPSGTRQRLHPGSVHGQRWLATLLPGERTAMAIRVPAPRRRLIRADQTHSHAAIRALLEPRLSAACRRPPVARTRRPLTSRQHCNSRKPDSAPHQVR
jgi:hypothetical protein